MIERAERLIEPVPLLDDRTRIWTRVECDDCHGTGLAEDAPPVRCRECGRDYSGLIDLTPETWSWEFLPCGHERLDLTPLAICLCCAGNGTIEQWCNLGAIFQAWQAWQETHQTPSPVALPSRPRARRTATKVSA